MIAGPELPAAAAPIPFTKLECQAPHRDPRRPGDVCGHVIGDHPGLLEFVALVARVPDEPVLDERTGEAYGHRICPKCKAVHRYRVGTPAASVPAVRRSLDERLEALQPDQLQAVFALAGGMSVTNTAKQIGVDRSTVQRWKKTPEVASLVRELAPQISNAQVREWLALLGDLIRKEVKDKKGETLRWALARTTFAEFERQKAEARRSAGTTVAVSNTNVQQAQLVQGAITSIWEKRHGLAAAAAAAAVAPED